MRSLLLWSTVYQHHSPIRKHLLYNRILVTIVSEGVAWNTAPGNTQVPNNILKVETGPPPLQWTRIDNSRPERKSGMFHFGTCHPIGLSRSRTPPVAASIIKLPIVIDYSMQSSLPWLFLRLNPRAREGRDQRLRNHSAV